MRFLKYFAGAGLAALLVACGGGGAVGGGTNPGGGGSGEVTWTLARVLKRPEFKTPNGKSLLYCSIPGSEMVEAARKAGIGGQAEAKVGAMTDNSYEPPVRLSGTVI